jgi:hypothetical protein
VGPVAFREEMLIRVKKGILRRDGDSLEKYQRQTTPMNIITNIIT